MTPVLTPGAERFVTTETFEALARRPAPRELYPHLAAADLLVVAPLSANTLAKLATGLADNVLTQLALAFRGPVLVAPAMNARMWEHAATRANVETLRARGVDVDRARGRGAGRGRDRNRPDERARGDARPLPRAPRRERGRWRGGRWWSRRAERVSRSTRCAISGTARADAWASRSPREARRRGADVTLIASNLAVPAPESVEVVEAPTAADLARETLGRADADVVVMAAAVADYRPAEPLAAKRKKDRGAWDLTLEPTEDVLAELGRRPPRRAGARRLRGRRGGGGPRGRPRQAGAQGREPLGLQRRIPFRHRFRLRLERGDVDPRRR